MKIYFKGSSIEVNLKLKDNYIDTGRIEKYLEKHNYENICQYPSCSKLVSGLVIVNFEAIHIFL